MNTSCGNTEVRTTMETLCKEEGQGDHIGSLKMSHDVNQTEGQDSEKGSCEDGVTDPQIGPQGDGEEVKSSECTEETNETSRRESGADSQECDAITSNQKGITRPETENRTVNSDSMVCEANKDNIPDLESNTNNMPDVLSKQLESKMQTAEEEDADFVDAQDTLEEEDAERWQDASEHVVLESSSQGQDVKVQCQESDTRTTSQQKQNENAAVGEDETPSSDSADGQDDADAFVAKAMEEEDEKKDEEKSIEVDEAARLEMEASMTEEEKEAKRDEAQEHKKSGNEIFKTGEFLDAVYAYTQALEICPLSFKKDRSIMFANRAACHVRLEHHDDAIQDCTKALYLNPVYLKVYLRRAQVYELTDKLDESLTDFQKVLELDPGNYEARAACLRLPDQIKERNEKLKEEMMGKLKDLGNLVLRPFGLSTENFQMQQDPNSGGYSINFNQNPTNGN
ncbi:uncharacterized protein [Amphiura filiformis]|uniref:uncharacterized protein n=1 Tax=Amphiura filiformis TaxID=82378 RepID=UPI003B2287A7